MGNIFKEDAMTIAESKSIVWEKFREKNILITGSTGLIGSCLIDALLYANEYFSLNMLLLTLSRDIEKATRTHSRSGLKSGCIKIYHGNIQSIPEISENIDYIIHCAAPTSSSFFIEHPVETIHTAVCGMMNILNLAIDKKIKELVFLSTMEVYGHPTKGSLITEDIIGAFNPKNVRNCYPLSKIICESLCKSYSDEMNVPSTILRLTQTFGPGVTHKDKRAFAEFAKCAVENKDIILKTSGKTERSYLYTADAVDAILTTLSVGTSGEVFNVANPKTYCSILEMANLVANDVANGKISVKCITEDVEKYGYSDTLYMNLDVSKLMSLGWHPKQDLINCFKRMICAMK